MEKTAIAGNHGDKVRSDCKVTLELTHEGGHEIIIQSKVKALYGNSINALIKEILSFYEIKDARILFEDSGALPHVIAARMEAAIRKVTGSKTEFLLPGAMQTIQNPAPERLRRSRLYLPGNNPAMMLNAGIYHPDGIILDLEDSVAPEKKSEARILVRNSLRAIDFFGAERMVRINQLPLGLDDIQAIAKQHVHMILLPKCEHNRQVAEVDNLLTMMFKDAGRKDDVQLMPIIESALGVENAYLIATASPRVTAMAVGLEDYTADIGVNRTEAGKESLYARLRIVNACKAAGIQPIDSVYSDVANVGGLKRTVAESKALGFEGMGCIHPAQIKVIHAGYMPSDDEIKKAKNIIDAYKAAREKGLGVISLGTKMIDPPVVKRAEYILSIIAKQGMEPK